MIIHRSLFKVFILIFFASFNFLAANVGGIVFDKETQEPLPGVNVSVVNSVKGDVTDKKGKFFIKYDQFKDSVELKFTYPGYKTLNKKFEVLKSLVVNLEKLSYRSNELVVTANKQVQSVQDVPISMATISQQDFSDRNITSMDYALQYVPGVEVNQDNVSIRGSSGFSFGVGSRVIFLQDGFPMLSADNNDIKFDVTPLLFVDRVEVIKGAGSALYGTSALGGVINVITSEPTSTPSIRTRIYSGIYDDPKYEQWKWSDEPRINNGLDLAYSQKFADYGLMVSASVFNRGSYKQYDELSRYSLFAKQTYDFSETTELKLVSSFTSSLTDDWVYWKSLDEPLVPPGPVSELKSDKLALYSGLKHIFDEQSFMNVKAGYYRTSFSNELPPDSSEYRESTGDSYYFETQYVNRLTDELSITGGIDTRYNNVTSVTYGVNDQLITAAYTQAEISPLEDLIITAGIRFDKEILDIIETNLQISPKLGLNYHLFENVTLRGSYGNGFRAPSIAERFANVQFQGFTVTPNPDLKPEVSKSFEIGSNIELLNDDNYLSFDVSGFINSFDNLIEPTFLADQGATIRFENITEAEISGIEIGVNYAYEKLIVFNSSLTLMEPENITTGRDLNYRSDILWYNSLTISYENFEFQTDYRYKSQYGSIDENIGFIVEDHDARTPAHIVDFRLSSMMELMEIKGRFSINVKNALNYYYLEMVGNMAPLRFYNFQIELDI